MTQKCSPLDFFLECVFWLLEDPHVNTTLGVTSVFLQALVETPDYPLVPNFLLHDPRPKIPLDKYEMALWAAVERINYKVLKALPEKPPLALQSIL